MNLADLQALLAGDEQDRVEKTVSGTDTDKFGEAICAFANDLPAHGLPGYLFVGSNQNGTASGLPITERLLENLGAMRLYNDRGDHQGPTNGGIIVLGLDALRFMPGAYVQYVHYSGPDKSTVVREQRIVGDLLTILRGIDQLAETLVGARPIRKGAAEQTIFDWPLVALHELFVNAVVHRDYESTAPVSISEFDDRLEILSPGGLYGMSAAAFPDAQGYRNPVLTEAARVYGFANRWGRGINAAQAALKANGSEPARFDVRFNHVLCSLARRR